MQDRIDVQGGKFSLKTLNVQDKINLRGENFLENLEGQTFTNSKKKANPCLQKCPKKTTSLRNNYVNFLGHLSSNGFQLKGRFGTHEILNIPISINVQDGINVQGGTFPQNQ